MELKYAKLGHCKIMIDGKLLIVCKLFQVVKCISAGYRHSAAVTEEGELYTWGEGDYGRLGIEKNRLIIMLFFSSKLQLNLSKSNLLETSFGVQNKQVFCLYRLN